MRIATPPADYNIAVDICDQHADGTGRRALVWTGEPDETYSYDDLKRSRLFSPDALRYRLADSGARVLLTDADNIGKALEMREALPDLRHVVLCGRTAPGGAGPGVQRPETRPKVLDLLGPEPVSRRRASTIQPQL